MTDSWISLPKLCTINPGKNEISDMPDNTEVSFIPMSSVSEQGEIDTSQIKLLGEVRKGYTYLREGDVLFAKITPCMENGKGGIAANLKNGIGFASTEFHILRPGPKILKEWLYLFLSLNGIRQLAKSNMTGSAGQKRAPASFLKKLKVFVPPLSKQRSIVALLSLANGLHRKRLNIIDLLDEFLRTTFLDMFGDPVKNPKNWKLRNIKKISEKFRDGPFGSNLKTGHYQANGVRVIRLNNIGINEFLNDDKVYISENHYSSLKKHTCINADVVIATMGNPNLRACILPKSIGIAINKADCIQCRPNKKIVLPEYISNLLNLPQTLYLVKNMIHGQTRSRISMGQLSTLYIPVPPIELQKRFTNIAKIIESLKKTMQKSLEEMDNLFHSLMQQAFKGELKIDEKQLDDIFVQLENQRRKEQIKKEIKDALREDIPPPTVRFNYSSPTWYPEINDSFAYGDGKPVTYGGDECNIGVEKTAILEKEGIPPLDQSTLLKVLILIFHAQPFFGFRDIMAAVEKAFRKETLDYEKVKEVVFNALHEGLSAKGKPLKQCFFDESFNSGDEKLDDKLRGTVGFRIYENK